MPLIGTLRKQPSEIVPLSISYAPVLAGQASGGISASISAAPAGLELTQQAVLGPVFQVLVGGGTSGQDYLVTVLAEIVVGGTTVRVEDEVRVKVQAVG